MSRHRRCGGGDRDFAHRTDSITDGVDQEGLATSGLPVNEEEEGLPLEDRMNHSIENLPLLRIKCHHHAVSSRSQFHSVPCPTTKLMGDLGRMLYRLRQPVLGKGLPVFLKVAREVLQSEIHPKLP